MKTPRTVARYLYDEYRAGRMTLHEAAREFHAHGWTNFVDEDYTHNKFRELENHESNNRD